MSDRREAVRANAKYLRQVRPIDPEEIATYVEGEPHPAVVAQVLREEAPDLELIERADGIFTPVPADPVSAKIAADGPVRRFPERYATALEDLLVERYGVDWHRGPSGDLVRSRIRDMKARYLDRQPVTYDDDVAAGYAIYHLPGYYAAIQYALEDLAERELLGRTLRVLDVGAGVGGPALGLCDYLPEDALLEYHAVEPGAGATILERLLEEAGRNVHPTIHRDPIESFEPPLAPERGFDLVLACNVLSELDDPEAVLETVLGWLAPSGALLAMAPADKNASIELRALERALEGRSVDPRGRDDAGKSDDGNTTRQITVYGPTPRLWGGETPSDRAWTFDVRPDLEVPAFQTRLDEAADGDGEFVNVDVQFSHSILRLDGRRRLEGGLEGSGQAKLAEMDRHVTNRIDCTVAKLSRSLSEAEEGSRRRGGDPNPVYKISDGSESVDHYAVVTNETGLNEALGAAEYGDLLALENVLVLWNDDEGAYNLVVDEETIVDRVG